MSGLLAALSGLLAGLRPILFTQLLRTLAGEGHGDCLALKYRSETKSDPKSAGMRSDAGDAVARETWRRSAPSTSSTTTSSPSPRQGALPLESAPLTLSSVRASEAQQRASSMACSSQMICSGLQLLSRPARAARRCASTSRDIVEERRHIFGLSSRNFKCRLQFPTVEYKIKLILYRYSRSPGQEKLFIWPPFFQYDKRLLRQKTGGLCLYIPQDGH